MLRTMGSSDYFQDIVIRRVAADYDQSDRGPNLHESIYRISSQPPNITASSLELTNTGSQILGWPRCLASVLSVIRKRCDDPSALGKNRPFPLTKRDPHEEHDLPAVK